VPVDRLPGCVDFAAGIGAHFAKLTDTVRATGAEPGRLHSSVRSVATQLAVLGLLPAKGPVAAAAPSQAQAAASAHLQLAQESRLRTPTTAAIQGISPAAPSSAAAGESMFAQMSAALVWWKEERSRRSACGSISEGGTVSPGPAPTTPGGCTRGQSEWQTAEWRTQGRWGGGVLSAG
jgi:hypothetical protein